MPRFTDRLKHAWNVFTNDEASEIQRYSYGPGTTYRQERIRPTFANDKSIIPGIYNRLAIDVAAIDIQHVRLDENDNFLEEMDSDLNYCLKVEANIDQAATAFKQDIAMSLFNKGVIALVPIDTTVKPLATGGFDVRTMRVAEILQFFPEHVQVNLYNDKLGRRIPRIFPKKTIAIIENPLYTVMNEQNSILQRLIRKLNLLDSIEEQAGSGKLDIIIQLPYPLRTETKRAQAETRRKDLESQMAGSQYGIGYVDASEKITQLNRPAENNVLKHVEYLTNLLYSQLGLTEEVFNGTATEPVMINYYNRTVEPILTAITEAMKRSFLSKTAITQRQSVEFYRDPFKLMTAAALAELGDKLTRNEILSSNEMRGIIGFKPRDDERANALLNKNMPEKKVAGNTDMGELKQVPVNPPDDDEPPAALAITR